MLSPEFINREVSVSQMSLENTFTIGRVFPEITGLSHWRIV